MSAYAPEELLTEVALGKMDAMERFYLMHQRTVYRYALSRLSDPFDAAEILNDVMLEVWRCAGRFEGRSAVSTWLLGMARYKIIDRLRARGRQVTTGAEELPEEVEDLSPTGERVLEKTQEDQRMRQCIDKLGPNHREVVHLAFYEEWNQEQIAEFMQCPPGTVKSRMYHAKEALKKCLERMMTRP
jgi:RNA polymerase sigma-70 factor, ECF subfamily